MTIPATRPGDSHATPDSVVSVDRSRWGPPLLYENAYSWLVLGSSLDVLLTGVILYGLRGIEANPIAAMFIEHWGLVGASLFKFALVTLAIILCDNVGRMRDQTGTRLSWVMVAISFIPVVWSLILLYSTITLPMLLPGS